MSGKKVNSPRLSFVAQKRTKIADDDAASMKHACEAATHQVGLQIQNLLFPTPIQGSFIIEDLLTTQLRSLRDAPPQCVDAGENIGLEEPELYRFDISMEGKPVFMDLPCEPGVFYARSGYLELYNHIASQWNSKRFRVILQGNAGTGKSWFQMYALKRLLEDKGRKFEIVIRQV
jgi:hypothetical protein